MLKPVFKRLLLKIVIYNTHSILTLLVWPFGLNDSAFFIKLKILIYFYSFTQRLDCLCNNKKHCHYNKGSIISRLLKAGRTKTFWMYKNVKCFMVICWIIVFQWKPFESLNWLRDMCDPCQGFLHIASLIKFDLCKPFNHKNTHNVQSLGSLQAAKEYF